MNRAFLVTQRQPVAFDAAADDARRRAGFASHAPSSAVCDSARVDVDDWHSLRYWCACLRVSEAQLLRAARNVGSSVSRIEAYFAEKQARRVGKA